MYCICGCPVPANVGEISSASILGCRIGQRNPFVQVWDGLGLMSCLRTSACVQCSGESHGSGFYRIEFHVVAVHSRYLRFC